MTVPTPDAGTPVCVCKTNANKIKCPRFLFGSKFKCISAK